MSIAFDILEEERERLSRLKQQYEQQLSQLRKGSLSRKRRWKREYVYLVYRKDGKVKFEYIGPADSDVVKTVSNEIEKRKELESKLRKIKANIIDVERGLSGKR